MVYEVDDRSSIPGRGKRFSLQRPDRLWVSSCVLSNGYRRLFPRGKAAGRLADRSSPSKAEVKNNRAIRLHGVVLKKLSTGTSFPLPWLGNSVHSHFG
jgi:hypothetical protein